EKVMEVSSKIRADSSIGQGSLFESLDMVRQEKISDHSTTDIPEWHEHELLANEKEVLGFYLSGHPLAKFKQELSFYSTHHLAHLPQNGNNRVRVAGIIENLRRLISKQQKSPHARFK